MAAIYQESSQRGAGAVSGVVRGTHFKREKTSARGTGAVSGVDEAGWLQQMVSGVDDLDGAEVHAYVYGARRVVVQYCTFMNAVRARS